MRIAISGHRGLPPDTEFLVDTEIRGRLSAYDADDLVGVSCLTDGADQTFASAVLDAGGSLEVVVPAEKYREELPESAKKNYDSLLERASQVNKLDYTEATAEARKEASREMLENADKLFAVWDGKPARSDADPAKVVDIAKELGIDVAIVWPEEARRK